MTQFYVMNTVAKGSYRLECYTSHGVTQAPFMCGQRPIVAENFLAPTMLLADTYKNGKTVLTRVKGERPSKTLDFYSRAHTLWQG